MSVAIATPPVRTNAPTIRRQRIRTFRIVRGNPPFSGRVTITVDAASTIYDLEAVALDPAFAGPGDRAFVCVKRFPDGKPAGEGYKIVTHQAEDGTVTVDCPCLGFQHYRHCRHADLLTALLTTRK